MKIVIVGTGRIGGWLARVLAADHTVAAWDRDPAGPARLAGVIPLAALSDVNGFAPDMLINAVTLAATIPVFRQIVPFLPPRCILADVTSIKGALPAYYAETAFRHVSVHPMFGPTFADWRALEGENAVIISGSDPEGARLFHHLFTTLGITVFECDFEEHDRLMGYSLTLPFVASMVFAACADGTPVPGSTFRHHREIATGLLAEDDNLLAEILFNPHSLDQLRHISSRLEFLKHVITARDHGEAGRLFARLRTNLAGRVGTGDSH